MGLSGYRKTMAQRVDGADLKHLSDDFIMQTKAKVAAGKRVGLKIGLFLKSTMIRKEKAPSFPFGQISLLSMSSVIALAFGYDCGLLA